MKPLPVGGTFAICTLSWAADEISHILAKAEIAENPEGKEIKNRKVCPLRCFDCTRILTPYKFLQRRKTSTKPRDASTPHGTTAAESVRNLLKKNPKYSKKINYAVLDQFFKREKSSTPENEDEEVDLHRIDGIQKDDEGEEVIEEGGEYQTPLRANLDFEDDEDDKPEEYGGWEDVFEQEV